ncbi:methionine adenosyltransferase [Nocardiopsis sp. N85]|uniref:methionine adenosyltransferase n=1 Tax=Nocardiopsis sp. N85 TaxID=3029400 RepID=UPI00237EEA6A|nr:methionine adenosyltransferase [Nocardiopsis sp. N85]MDE3725280.1 methionine adenosyltransferase [Nocardiopsis sp. N85]
MRITWHCDNALTTTTTGFNVVERKGIGHPDSLADLIAEEFSRRYSRHGINRFGFVPNHWVDKVALIGAESEVTFGTYTVRKPVTAYLFGKMTRSIGAEALPIEDLFTATVEEVLVESVGRDILLYLRTVSENTAGVGADHPASFYRPAEAGKSGVHGKNEVANDTAFCNAYAPADPVDLLAIDIENHVNSPAFKADLDGLGSDVKVMIVRASDVLETTVCLPVRPEAAPSRQEYRALITEAQDRLTAFVEAHPVVREHPWLTRMSVNTKDHGQGAYLAPFGTSLGKGDCGLVGRGNKANGVISSRGGGGIEAPAGKNPMHHTGKLYTLAAEQLASRIHGELGIPNAVVLVSRNGDRLDDPSFVGVRTAYRAGSRDRTSIEGLAAETLSGLPALSERLLSLSPIERFRDPALVLEV